MISSAFAQRDIHVCIRIIIIAHANTRLCLFRIQMSGFHTINVKMMAMQVHASRAAPRVPRDVWRCTPPSVIARA